MGQRRRRQLASLVVTAAALAGCGGDSAEERQARRACEENARKAAEAIVIDLMYERGDLGPEGRVREEIERNAGPEEELFEPDGRLRPWNELDEAERSTLAVFWTSDRIDALTWTPAARPRLRRAELLAVETQARWSC